jgi:hypothetical protein
MFKGTPLRNNSEERLYCYGYPREFYIGTVKGGPKKDIKINLQAALLLATFGLVSITEDAATQLNKYVKEREHDQLQHG